jgi:aspartyl-tRNA(Asn)/glutamyl-tRNA(Gln) amidotransferase subunit B
MSGYEAVIGLEVHVQLATAAKIFCGCSTRFGAPPNTQVCPVCTGQPGALPVLNRRAVDLALRLALACGCTVRGRSRFARKSYFYPDLPKGYQITQHEQPLAEGGAVEIGGGARVNLTRIHLEEDAGKTIHGRSTSSVDLNRAGVPLCEIVSEPDLRRPEDAAEYLRVLRGLVRALAVSDGNMEQGSLRCDANVSLRPAGSDALGVKTEIKNLNSFRFVQRALEHEIARQRARLAAGGALAQETRLWDADAGVTRSMRSKEQGRDYRYFPDPDLPPLWVDGAWIARVRAALPELPRARRARLVAELGLSEHDADRLTRERELADYFEATVAAGGAPGRAARWITTELLARVPDPRAVGGAPVTPERLAGLLALWDAGRINSGLAKRIFALMWEGGESAEAVAGREGLFQQQDASVVEAAVRRVVAGSPELAAQYRAGRRNVLGYLVGQVMRTTRGRADPRLVNELLRRELSDQD